MKIKDLFKSSNINKISSYLVPVIVGLSALFSKIEEQKKEQEFEDMKRDIAELKKERNLELSEDEEM